MTKLDTDASAGNGLAAFCSGIAMLAVLAALGTATLVDMFDGPGSLRQERTARTPVFPRDMATFKAFPGAAKGYVAERYALKDTFIETNTRVKRGLFGHSPYTRVMLGRDDTLFLGNDGVIAAVQGVTPPMEASDAAWETLFADMQEAFARRSIPLVHLIAPDKHTVLPEALPRWLYSADRSRVSRVVSRLQSQISPPPVDLVRFFDAHRKTGSLPPLYHSTDTHWTEYGAAQAVDAAIASVLDADMSSVPHAVSMIAEKGGDLARMLGLQGSVNATAPQIRRPDRLSCETPEGRPVAIVSLDPLPTRRFTCRNPEAPAKHALVYMDSFGMAAVPRLVQIFQQVDFIWSDVVDMAEVDRIAPKIAIRIMVARKLQTVDAATLFRTTQ